MLVYLLASLGVLQSVIVGMVVWTGDGVLNAGPLPQIHMVNPGMEMQELVREIPLFVRIISTLPTLIVGGVGLAAAFLLAGALARIARGEAFSARTRLTLARLSLVLVLGSVVAFLVDAVAVALVQREMRSHPWVLDEFTIAGPSFPVFLVTLGIVTAALLFAFRDGAVLEREAEGVI